tara:strand:- start:297 stop:992 length:696 start_codon:yes stop_codon:yes gene_type:complete
MINFLSKITFLKKSNARNDIIINFVITKLTNFLVKNKIKRFKKENITFLKSKKITHDYFSPHSYNFHRLMKSIEIENLLEIGSFEGNSSMFFARHLPDSKIYCVDNWIGTEEYNNLNFESLENNFDRNLKEFNNVIKNKCTSDQFFENNNSNFDLIYIDGYHKAEQVLKDFKNAWKVLNKNGILIFDDFIWKFFEKIEDNPCFVINAYLKDLNKEFKILKVSNSQLFIKKI